MAKAVGAMPIPCWCGKPVGSFPMQWGHGQTLGGVAKAVAKALGAWPRPLGRSQGCGGVAKALGAWPRPWGLGKCRGGVAKAVEALPRPWGRFQGRGGVVQALGRGQGREG